MVFSIYGLNPNQWIHCDVYVICASLAQRITVLTVSLTYVIIIGIIVQATILPIMIIIRYIPIIVILACILRCSMRSINGVISIVIKLDIRSTSMSDWITYKI